MGSWGGAAVTSGGGWSTGPAPSGSSGTWSFGPAPSAPSSGTWSFAPAPAPAPSYYPSGGYSLLTPLSQQAPARSYDVADPYGEGGLYVEFDSPLLQFLKGGQSPELTAQQRAQRNLVDLLLLGGIIAVLLK